MRYHLTLVRKAMYVRYVKRLQKINAEKEVEKRETSDPVGRNVNWLALGLVMESPRAMTTVVLKRNIENPRLPIFGERGWEIGGWWMVVK